MPTRFRMGTIRVRGFYRYHWLMDPLELARQLRRQSTDVEHIIWSRIRNRRLAQWKFRRQVSLGAYVVDFVCFETKLIVEADGSHHAIGEQLAHDQARDEWLRSEGFTVLRFWNDEILNEWSFVEERIWQSLNRLSQ